MAKSAYSANSRKTISRHIKKHKEEGMPQDQAVAAAMSEARRKGEKVPKRRSGSQKKAGSKKRSGTKKARKSK